MSSTFFDSNGVRRVDRKHSRRTLLRNASLVTGAMLTRGLSARALPGGFPQVRPEPGKRRFQSEAVEAAIRTTTAKISNPELAWIFANCLPNTLDTTVFPAEVDGKPDTFVITGDIDAMWLRDSSAQIEPYLAFARTDRELRRLIEGVVRRQARCVLLDSYANAFCRQPEGACLTWSATDKTEMRPGVGERKWEVDSLAYVMRLSGLWWQTLRDRSPFDGTWREAMHRILITLREQQRRQGRGPYHFQRTTPIPSDTLMLDGYGNPARPDGMVASMFRPSDDACIYPHLVPSNLFAAAALRQLAIVATEAVNDSALSRESTQLAAEIETATRSSALVNHPRFGTVWAYEVDGFGNRLLMDDANAPSLLALPHLGYCATDDKIYQSTRRLVLSSENPYHFTGTAAQGIGSPHTGLNAIWPMSLILQTLTSTDPDEMTRCIGMLIRSSAGSGYMHESFNPDNVKQFTRPWFAWANTLFGALVLQLADRQPKVLRMV